MAGYNNNIDVWSLPSTSNGQPSSSNCISPMNEYRQDDSDLNKSSLNRFRRDKKFTDVNIVIAGRQFPCHRIILAWKSSYFEEMFNNDNQIRNIVDDAVLEEMGVELLNNILNFIYTDDSTSANINTENVVRMYNFAHVLGITVLQEKAGNFIKKRLLKVDHQVEACLSAFHREDVKLFNSICKRLSKQPNFDELMQKGYVDLPYEVFHKIIENTDMKVENEKVDAIMKWVNVDVRRIPSKIQLGKLVDKDKVTYGKWMKLIEGTEEITMQIATHCVLVSNENNKRARLDDKIIEEVMRTFKRHKNLIDHPSTSRNIHRLKIFADTFYTDGHHNMNEFSFEDNEWNWLPNEKIDVVCDRLKSVCLNNCKYFLTFQCGNNDSPRKNLFWMVNANGEKKDLAGFPTIVKNYRLTIVDGELILYDVDCTMKNRSLMRYDFQLNKWCYIKSTMALYNAGVAGCKGLYYLCGGTTEDANSNKKVYCSNRRLSGSVDLPEMIHHHDHAVACSHNERIYVYGGQKGEFELFDPTESKWWSLCPNKHSEFTHCMEKFLVSNGENVLLMNENGDNTIYSCTTQTWSPLRPFPSNFRLSHRTVTGVIVKDVIVE